MATVDWLVPTVIFITLFALIYVHNKDPIDRAIDGIKQWFDRKKEIQRQNEEYEAILTYR